MIDLVLGLPEPSDLHELESQLSSPISIFWNTISYSPILKYKLQYRKMQVCDYYRHVICDYQYYQKSISWPFCKKNILFALPICCNQYSPINIILLMGQNFCMFVCLSIPKDLPHHLVLSSVSINNSGRIVILYTSYLKFCN